MLYFLINILRHSYDISYDNLATFTKNRDRTSPFFINIEIFEGGAGSTGGRHPIVIFLEVCSFGYLDKAGGCYITKVIGPIVAPNDGGYC